MIGQAASARVGLHLITGFLGSGKTTLLREVLAAAHPQRIGVLVNDVGEIGLDHHLLDRVDEDTLLLPGGCVCCALRDELHAAVARLLAHRPDRVLLETTGLADPAPLLHTLGTEPRLRAMLQVQGVICVVDALRAEELLGSHDEVRRQLDLCDRVVITKTDLASPQRVATVRALVADLAPGREVRCADQGRVEVDWLLRATGFGAGAPGGLRRWLRLGDPHAAFRCHAVRHPDPVDIDVVMLWLRLVTQVDGPRLLRIKSLVRGVDGGAWVLQSANRSVSPPLRLARLPADLTGAEVVVVERGMPEAATVALLASLRQALAAGASPARPVSPR